MVGKVIPCLESHSPVDLVLLMLGTNDLKDRFSASAFNIASGAGILINTIQQSCCGPDGKSPKVLLICPPPLGKLSYLSDPFASGVEKSRELAKYYKKVAGLYGCDFLDAGQIIKTSDIDGVNFD